MCNQLGGPRATAIAGSEKAKFMKFVPWAGVAARLSTTEVVSSAGEGSSSLPPPPRGAAYCFLPLPVQTGLPVHVNGYFELSSNRYERVELVGYMRPGLLLLLLGGGGEVGMGTVEKGVRKRKRVEVGWVRAGGSPPPHTFLSESSPPFLPHVAKVRRQMVWALTCELVLFCNEKRKRIGAYRRDIWSGSDMVGDGELRANWNKALVEELAASCYTRVLLAAKAALGGGEAYEALWPTGPTAEGGMWRGLADSLMRLVKPLPLLRTRSAVAVAAGGWVTPQKCVVWAAGGVGGEKGGGEGDEREHRALAEVLLAEKVRM